MAAATDHRSNNFFTQWKMLSSMVSLINIFTSILLQVWQSHTQYLFKYFFPLMLVVWSYPCWHSSNGQHGNAHTSVRKSQFVDTNAVDHVFILAQSESAICRQNCCHTFLTWNTSIFFFLQDGRCIGPTVANEAEPLLCHNSITRNNLFYLYFVHCGLWYGPCCCSLMDLGSSDI